MAQAFPYKIDTENELYTFDFSQVLSAGETLVTASCAIQVDTGVDNNPSAMLSGSAYTNNTKAIQRLIGGVGMVTYRLTMTVNTNNGNTYVAVAFLPVYKASQV